MIHSGHGECVGFEKYRGEVLGDWRKTLERRPENHSVEPTEKVWRGQEDGLPPIGTELQNQLRERRIVIAHDGDVVVCRCEDTRHYRGYTPDEQKLLKPIRSEEDSAVDEMVNYRKAHHWSDEQFCRELYRAGYRKQEDK